MRQAAVVLRRTLSLLDLISDLIHFMVRHLAYSVLGGCMLGPHAVHRTGAVLVLGAATPCGIEVSNKLASMGYTVFAAVDDPAESDRLAAVPNCTPLHLDSTSRTTLLPALSRLQNATRAGVAGSRLVAVVSVAGSPATPCPLELVHPSTLRTYLESNCVSIVACVQMVLPLLRESKGRVICVGSAIGSSGGNAAPMGAAYAAARCALACMCDALRVEVAPQGVGVAMVEPASGDPYWFGIGHRSRVGCYGGRARTMSWTSTTSAGSAVVAEAKDRKLGRRIESGAAVTSRASSSEETKRREPPPRSWSSLSNHSLREEPEALVSSYDAIRSTPDLSISLSRLDHGSVTPRSRTASASGSHGSLIPVPRRSPSPAADKLPNGNRSRRVSAGYEGGGVTSGARATSRGLPVARSFTPEPSSRPDRMYSRSTGSLVASPRPRGEEEDNGDAVLLGLGVGYGGASCSEPRSEAERAEAVTVVKHPVWDDPEQDALARRLYGDVMRSVRRVSMEMMRGSLVERAGRGIVSKGGVDDVPKGVIKFDDAPKGVINSDAFVSADGRWAETARCVAKALTDVYPRTRYKVGWDAWMATWTR
ncbi:hypothetical protein HK101_000742, partial [Irineochytrium annulatum]